MAKAQYRLQTLYEIREKAKQEAEKAYAAKKHEVIEAEKVLEEMHQHLRDMAGARAARKEEYTERMRSGELSIDKIQANDRHLDRMKNEENAYKVDISRQTEDVAERQSEADEALEEVFRTTQEFKALEKHKEKWAIQVRKELMAKEEEAAEDISQAQYFSRQKAKQK